jgi:hypothetical protein
MLDPKVGKFSLQVVSPQSLFPKLSTGCSCFDDIAKMVSKELESETIVVFDEGTFWLRIVQTDDVVRQHSQRDVAWTKPTILTRSVLKPCRSPSIIEDCNRRHVH